MPADGGFSSLSGRRGGNAWMGELIRGEKGPHATVANTVLVVGNDPDLTGLAAYDEFSHQIVLTRAPPPDFIGAPLAPGPYPRPVADADVTRIQTHVQRCYDMRISQAVAQQAVVNAAELVRIHPIRDWLSGLHWDGTERIDTWLQGAFGSPDDAYHRAIGAKFLVAGVRRVRRPGCKFDHMPVLEGDQGAGKSRTCAALFGQSWFADSLPHDLGSRDAALGLLGRWGVELGELESLIRSEVETVKAFLSRSTDYYRPPYGRSYVERPRQGVLIGTTNQHDYLRDATGNRRFWPIRCLCAEAAWVAENREQLWAEAAAREAQGEPIWLDDEAVSKTARKHQAERLAEDMWAGKIRLWLRENGHREVRAADVLANCLGLAVDKQTRGNEMRVASVLRADGWKPGYRWIGTGNERCWRAPPADAPA